MGERLVVGGVYRAEDRALLGQRVRAVEGVAWQQLVSKAHDRSVAVLRIGSMMRYREAFEVWRSTGYTANLREHLSEVVRAPGRPIPDSVDELGRAHV